MISKADLQAKEKIQYDGREFKANNGCIVILPSMPMGKISKKFIKARNRFTAPEFIGEGDAQKPNPDYIEISSETGMEFVALLFHMILSLNYNITEEEADGLFSMHHLDPIFAWFYSGKTEAEFRNRIAEATGSAGGASGSSFPTGQAVGQASKNGEPRSIAQREVMG